MVILDEDGSLVADSDLSVGKLVGDAVPVTHRWVTDSEEVGHWEVTAEYDNGGRDVEWRVDEPETGRWETVGADGEPVEHFDGIIPDDLTHEEDHPDVWTFQRYVPYTEDELAEMEAARAEAEEERERESQMRSASVMMVRMQAPSLTDEQCLSVSLLFEDWGEGIACKEGLVYRYGGLIYRCQRDHTSQKGWEPGVATASLWTAITPDGPQPWQPGQSYDVDAEVTHNGKTWVSLVPNNVWEPGATGTETVWREK